VLTVVRLPTGKALTVRASADAFLDSLGNPNTMRNYGIAIGKIVDRIGEGRPLATVEDDEVGEALELPWGASAVNTWNARRASVLSWLGWCDERGYDGPSVPAWAKRLTPPDSETPARSKMAIDRLIARREVHLRKKTLWRMLYETCARAEEILGVNVEDLDLAGRRCPVKTKGARPCTRRRGAVREDFVLETVYWDAGTARLLPRLLKRPQSRASVRYPPQARPWQGRQPTRCLPGHRAGPALVWPSPRFAGRAHRDCRARHGLGPARIPSLRSHAPRRGRRKPADAHGQIPAQEAGERPEILPSLPGRYRRSDQLARAW
jgi:integrase